MENEKNTKNPKTKHVKIWKQGTRRGPGLNSRQDLFDASERSAAGGDSNPFGNEAPIQWAGPKGRLSPHPS